MTNYELEEMTIAFLKAHDEYYTSTKKNKKKTSEYCYETVEQTNRRESVERCFSGLSKKDMYRCLKNGVDYSLLPDF